MWNLRLLFLVGLATGFISDKLFVSSQSPHSTTDDMYLEGQTSGDLPIDDEDREIDGSGGSGSGDYIFTHMTDEEERLMKFLNFSRTTVSKEMVPNQPQPTANPPREPPTTAAESQHTPTTMIYDVDSPEEVTSENLWERTEVLAAVIACGVVGFLCAVFLLLLLAYRMKKKDEGSYDLGDTKLSTTTYHKAPTKEFYA
ncbi:Syndecan-2-B [Collichthys lucidus]|uniref:Syndecan n=1 Tax=Collichthys lucidus TaxID=240159 RepID=A0A4U5V5T6_COLLU|nr:Syndecan-2-B [Collichthys lucidus]